MTPLRAPTPSPATYICDFWKPLLRPTLDTPLIYDDFSDKVELKLDNNNGFIADRSCRTMVVLTSQLHYFMLLYRTESRHKRQFGSNSLLFTAFKTV